MSLLPALFANQDPLPTALGRKIETPAPKNPDPIAAFERGDHRPEPYGQGWAGVQKYADALWASVTLQHLPPTALQKQQEEDTKIMLQQEIAYRNSGLYKVRAQARNLIDALTRNGSSQSMLDVQAAAKHCGVEEIERTAEFPLLRFVAELGAMQRRRSAVQMTKDAKR